MRQRGKVKSKGARSPRSARGTPLPKARLTRKIDLAKPQPADCHFFGARVNKKREKNRRQFLTNRLLSLVEVVVELVESGWIAWFIAKRGVILLDLIVLLQ